MTAENGTPGEDSAVAVVGMAGRFPGARDLRQFWENLAAGVESVKVFTDDELIAAGESEAVFRTPAYVRACPALDGIELFDAPFFGMSARDAAIMDPQHRFFLEVAWEAMEDAGYDPERAPGQVGVFATNGMNAYMMHHLVNNREVMESVGEWLVRHTGNDMSFLATRVSYRMNLKGPSMNVQTACSSSLVALHLACQSLLTGECDMALVGASTIVLPQDRGYVAQEGEILSRDGHCRPFDARSSGTLFGSGTSAVVLKRLSDALSDGDTVRAIVRGTAINNDGSSKVGYLAPSVEGQSRVISEALAISGVDPESISYIEAHGTATSIGDPIELTGLTEAFRAHTAKKQFCALGSVKGNVGHLGEAAGMAALVKTVLAFEHRKIPPSINYETPNPEIDFSSSPVFVNTRLVDWLPVGPRRAGITSLGAGGTNAHAILEEAPPLPARARAERESPEVLLVSARSAEALDAATARLAEHLKSHPDVDLGDVAYTLDVGRRPMAHRRAFVAGSPAEAVTILEAPGQKLVSTHALGRQKSSLSFLFPGGGAQYVGMGRELYASEPVYRAALEECFGALPPDLAKSLRRLILESAESEEASAEIERPLHSVTSVFSVSYAMSKLLSSWDLVPAAMIGHSMGEYVAAVLASVMSVESALSLLVLRGKIFESLPPGGMLSIPLPEAEVRELLGDALSVAAVNAPSSTVVSGPTLAIDALERQLAERDVDAARVHIGVAAHSSMLEPFLAEFEQAARRVELREPRIPFVSNVTGDFIEKLEATNPMYWVKHLRRTVRFGDGLGRLLAGDDRVLLEVGPGRTLSSLAREQPKTAPAIPVLRHPRESVSDVRFLLSTVGRLWTHGIEASFGKIRGDEPRRRVSLPTYPFEHKRYWVERGNALATSTSVPRKRALAKKTNAADWFYLPSFRRSVAPKARGDLAPFLVFADGRLGDRVASHLSPDVVVRVTPGPEYRRIADDHFAIRPGKLDDYTVLIEELRESGRMPRSIVHTWAVTPAPLFSAPAKAWKELATFDEQRERSFDSLLLLAHTLSSAEEPIALSVLSSDLHSLADEPVRDPVKALLLGPTRVIPRELPHVRARNIDVGGGELPDAALSALIAELRADVEAPVIVYRGVTRWVPSYDPVRLEASPAAVGIRPSGTYLVTGGLGGIGLEIGEHLARTANAKLVLVGRSEMPARRAWDDWIARHGSNDTTTHRIQKIRAMEALGAEVLTARADVTDRVQMEGALSVARARFGAIHGVIHAAGTIDDGLIALKELDSAHAVIATKAKGALVLDALFGKDELDFFVVFSSVSSLLGLPGQVDYTAANAFLDAFAVRRNASRGRTISVNWNAWQSVGMAVALADRGRPSATVVASDPGRGGGTRTALGRIVNDSEHASAYAMPMNRAGQWLLSEHVVRGGEALIPGTGYLELARAALETRPERRAVELSDVFFLAPFVVRAGETRELRIDLDRDGGEFSFVSDSEESPHVIGKVRYVDASPPSRVDLDRLRARCVARIDESSGFLDQSFMDFGRRWGNVRRVGFGDGEALLRLELPPEYHSDLATYRLHPALLDMATGGAQSLIPGFDAARDFYVPFSYGKLLQRTALPPRLWSHVRLRSGGAGEAIATFDVTLYDTDGVEVASVASFVMKRVDADAVAFRGEPVEAPALSTRSGQISNVGLLLQTGILPAEGVDAFQRILDSSRQVVVCSVDLSDWMETLEAEGRELAIAGTPAAAGAPARAASSKTFVAPRDDVERELVKMWEELLGGSVGIHDDFFEIGGQSLVAVRLFNKIRKRYAVDLPLSTLFDAPTIADCAEVIREELGLGPLEPTPESVDAPAPVSRSVRKRSRWASLVPMQSKGALPPFFCVAGMGGTLNNLRALARLLGEARPFVGLQPPGAGDPSERLYTVEDLAAHYIKDIKAVQPQGPYHLGGYSGGGIVAFEMCRKLEAAGESIAFLGFLDSFSPELPLRPLADRARIHLSRAKEQGPTYVTTMLGRRLAYQRTAIARRAQRELGKIFPDRYRYENLQDSFIIAEGTYHPKPWSGRAVLFRARQESALGAWTAYVVDEQHGWGRFIEGGVEIVVCAGDHATMCEEPHVRDLARKLRGALDAVPVPRAPDVDAAPATSKSHAGE